MKKRLTLIASLCAIVALSAWDSNPEATKQWDENATISEVLTALGDERPSHFRDQYTAEQVSQGRDLVHEGRTIGPNGKRSKYISKFYMCTSCHTQAQEDPDLRKSDPEARLDYVAKNGLKFLQGSTFYGIVNRESWYNDDYYLKYGDLVRPANKSLAEATQLCAKVCASGRYLEDWELEAILAYYWSIQYRLKDLQLTAADYDRLNKGDGDWSKEEKIKWLKSFYAQKSPATFGHEPENKDSGYGMEGRADKGKMIYELSCQACHKPGGVSHMILDDSKLTFVKLRNNVTKHNDYCIYDISRHGTYAGQGKPRYMPLYTEERMSHQQLEDLRAYIFQQAN